MMATEATAGDKNNNKQGAGTNENRVDTPVQKGLHSSEITEELLSGQHGTRQTLILEISTTSTLEEAREDFLTIDMPLTPPPRRVNFSPCPCPGFSKINESPGPSSSKNRSTIKTLLPKLSLKIQNTSSQIEKATLLEVEGSLKVAQKNLLLLS